MSVQLPLDPSGAGDLPRGPDPGRRAAPDALLRRVLTRIAWRDDPTVRLRHIAHDDALIVEILPLPAVTERVVDDLLCLEFDGDDAQAMPTTLCLTGLTALPNSPAARCTQQVLGEFLWSQAQAMLAATEPERVVVLDEAVYASRLKIWRRLTGLGLGIEVEPGLLRAALASADGEVIATTERALNRMEPPDVVAGIAGLVAEISTAHHTAICGTPVVLGVQVPGPTDPERGVVHYFRKRSRTKDGDWRWTEVPLAADLQAAVDLPALVLNDVMGFATYDRWFHPSPERCRAVLLIAQGIGAKLVIDGRIDTRMPMEVGNMVLHVDGSEGDSGARGCLETTAGTLAIVERISELTGIYVEDIAHAVAVAQPDGGAGDESVLGVFREAGRDLARVIGNVQVIANPRSWAIYGPEPLLTKDSAAGAAFLEELLDFEPFVAHHPYRHCRVNRRPIVDVEGPLGAALAALERFGLARPDRSADPRIASEDIDPIDDDGGLRPNAGATLSADSG